MRVLCVRVCMRSLLFHCDFLSMLSRAVAIFFLSRTGLTIRELTSVSFRPLHVDELQLAPHLHPRNNSLQLNIDKWLADMMNKTINRGSCTKLAHLQDFGIDISALNAVKSDSKNAPLYFSRECSH